MKKTRFNHMFFVYFVLLLLAVILGVERFRTTNPLCDNPGADSLCFSIIGRGMLNGMVPYRDLIDNKGLVLYFLNAFPQFIFPYEIFNNFGIWIFEVIFLWITLIFIHKSANLIGVKVSIIAELAFWALLYKLSEGGNLCEEYSLCFSFIGIYYALKYIKGDASSRHLLYSFIVGTVFTLAFFCRPNNALPLFGMILGVLIYLVIRKKYQELLKCIAGRIIGFLIIFIPMVIYLYVNGALEDCVTQTILANLSYSSVSGGILNSFYSKYLIIAIGMAAVTLLSSLIYMITYRKSLSDVIIGLSTALAGLFSLWSSVMSGYSFMHYLMIPLVPFSVSVILGCRVVWEMVDRYSAKMQKKSKIIFVCFAAIPVLLCVGYLNLPAHISNTVKTWQERIAVYTENGGCNNKQKEVLSIIEKIPMDERNSIYTLTSIDNNYFYLYTNTYPCYRLFVCHELFKQVIPGLEEEYNEFMNENPPKYLILTQKDLTDNIEENYVFFDSYNDDKVMIMKRK